MKVDNVAALVRAGHKFVGLSDRSVAKLEELRQFFALVPAQANVVDGRTGETTCDDDALIDALYNVVVNKMTNHADWDVQRMVDVTIGRATITSTNIGRTTPLVVRGEIPGSPSRARAREGSPSANSPSRAVATQDAPASGNDERRDDTTDGEMRLFDVPMHLISVASIAAQGIAVVEHPLTASGIHRCTVQVTAMPPHDGMVDEPPCIFGICHQSVAEENEISKWIGLQWRAGFCLPCAANVTATTVNDQPAVRGADGHNFIRVGDVLSIETRPTRAESRTLPPKYEKMLSEQRNRSGAVQPPPVSIDAFFFLNGVQVAKLANVGQYQPIDMSWKYRDDPGTDPKAANKRQAGAGGLTGCRFGVQLCPGAAVALYRVGGRPE